MSRRLAPALAIAVALLASGSDVGADGPQQHIVGQKNKKFSVDALTVRRGDSIRFVNDDDVTHNVYSQSSTGPFNLKLQPPGAADEVRLENAGKMMVRCAIHPMMKLEVTVEP